MRRLISLISTKGKTTEQVSKEAMEAYQNYQQVKAKVEKDLKKKLTKLVVKVDF